MEAAPPSAEGPEAITHAHLTQKDEREGGNHPAQPHRGPFQDSALVTTVHCALVLFVGHVGSKQVRTQNHQEFPHCLSVSFWPRDLRAGKVALAFLCPLFNYLWELKQASEKRG